MITIKMYNEHWQILIGDEKWQFKNREEFDKYLKQILDIKDKYGKLKYDRDL